MLYRYSVENYKSFKEKAELSFVPISAGCSHVVNCGKIKCLKSAVIYGANASGKSNLIKSIDFVRDSILGNRYLGSQGPIYYKLDEEYSKQPSVFCVELIIDNRLYQYGFSILSAQLHVVEEWLYELVHDGEIMIFNRRYLNEKKEYEIVINEDLIQNSKEKERMNIYIEDMKSNKYKLFLTDVAEKKVQDNSTFEIYNAVFKWFKELNILFPSSRFNLLIAVDLRENEINDIYKGYFNIFDIDIENIHLKDVSVESLNLENEEQTEIRSKLLKDSTGKYVKMMINIKGKEYLLGLDANNELVAKEVKFKHKTSANSSVEFAKYEESDGTKRLFDLIPAIARAIQEESILIIDEIDRSLHSLLTYKIIELFLEKSQDSKSQIICSTHSEILLDITLLRSDEIWMVNKKEGASELYPLAKYKVKFPQNIKENYLLGRYQAIPLF